jgi:hypothetical protein
MVIDTSALLAILCNEPERVQVLGSAATKSVFEKSRPLNSNGNPLAFANAYEKQWP